MALVMREYEIYLPTKHNDGTPVDPAQIDRIEQQLARTFGGYTHLKQHSAGLWRMGGVTFLDEVTIVRVIDDETDPLEGFARFDMPAFKRELEVLLQQESVLIVARDVQVL